ncbi:MAG: 30S ribosomal protein S17 [Patescibacteria group bacterium]
MNSQITRTKKGIVVSDKMDKTVVVSIDRVKAHPLYKKKYTVSKKYKADDQENQYKIGDVVEIVSVKPISKDKKYKVLRKVA